ncbi:MAG: hypothetical protein JW852_03550, partial [Spirochaetales bacterium]|nr:hypothetical protein [Spirochaetales bacterium]
MVHGGMKGVPGVDGGNIAAHVRYALSLANLAYKGENACADADWPGSWPAGGPDKTEWRELLDGLHSVFTLLEQNVASVREWNEIPMLTGTIALIAHGAWHLGAVR